MLSSHGSFNDDSLNGLCDFGTLDEESSLLNFTESKSFFMVNRMLIIVALTLFMPFAFASSPELSLKPGGKIGNGDQVPDLTMKNLNGKQISLKSLRGKIVLVYFWASWCKPCKKTMPRHVQLYKKYKNASFDKGGGEGFAIYSISLDKKRNKWKKANERFGLPWKTDVSDLKHWDSKAVKKFGIESIPRSFLVDGKGKVIAKDVSRNLNFVLKRLKK